MPKHDKVLLPYYLQTLLSIHIDLIVYGPIKTNQRGRSYNLFEKLLTLIFFLFGNASLLKE